MLKEISAGIIIYRKTKEGLKFLILYHGRGYWNFPKGKIEHKKNKPPAIDSNDPNAPLRIIKESSFQTALREVKEETGLNRHHLKFNNFFKTYEKFTFWRRFGDKNIKIFKIVIFYLAETKKTNIQISHEHEGYGWFTYKEALKILNKYKESQKVLTDAYKFLKNKKRYFN